MYACQRRLPWSNVDAFCVVLAVGVVVVDDNADCLLVLHATLHAHIQECVFRRTTPCYDADLAEQLGYQKVPAKVGVAFGLE